MHTSSERRGCLRATWGEVSGDSEGAFPLARIDGADCRPTAHLQGVCGATDQQVPPARDRDVSADGPATTNMMHPTEAELDAYADGWVNSPERDAIRAHLEECLDCN